MSKMMKIKPLKELVDEAFSELKQFQTGKRAPVKTGRPYVDNLFGGLLAGDVLTIAAGSGVGKTYELDRVITNIMDESLNPNASKYVCLDVSLEMRVFSKILRGAAKHLKKDKKKVLLEEFTEEERQLLSVYYNRLADGRHFIAQEPTTPNEFYQACKQFLEQHKDKEAVFITADHVVLFNSDKGGGKQEVVESLLERVNDLKMEYKNVYFILLSQLNTQYIQRAKDKDIMSKPMDLDLYYSQFTFQVSSFVVVIANPYKTGINDYLRFHTSRYEHLEKYFSAETKGKASFRTVGNLFYHLLKSRENDAIYDDIFIEELNLDVSKYKAPEIPKKDNIDMF